MQGWKQGRNGCPACAWKDFPCLHSARPTLPSRPAAVFVGLTACMGSANANRLRTYLMLMVSGMEHSCSRSAKAS